MAEGCEEKSTCARCLRSSVIASLVGFILVLIGGGAYGGATIFARRYLVDMLDAPNLFPCLDYVVYGLIGAICLFTLLAYLLCVLSSGRNAKCCFDSHLKSACGRCCNMTLLLLLVCAVLLWTAIACVVSYPFFSIAIMSHRDRTPDPQALSNNGQELSKFVAEKMNPAESSISMPEWPKADENFVPPTIPHVEPPWGSDEAKRVRRTAQSTDEEIYHPDSWPGKLKTDQVGDPANQLPSGGDLEKTVDSLLSNPKAMEEAAAEGKKLLTDVANTATKAGTQLLACSPNMIDLSYYGLYNENGSPILITRTKLDEGIKQVFICLCISIAGVFLLLLGYLQIIICTALNYARLQETRYYGTSDAGEEGVALQQ